MGTGPDLGLEASCTALQGSSGSGGEEGRGAQVEGSTERPRRCRRLWSGSSGEEDPVQLSGQCWNTRLGLCPAGKTPGLRTGLGGLPRFPFSFCCLLAHDLGQNAYPH